MLMDRAQFLSYEEFLEDFKESMSQNDRESLSKLQKTYPAYYNKAFIQQIPAIPDWDSSSSPYPILQLPVNYSPCVINIISYLVTNPKTVQACISYLFQNLQSTIRRNIRTDEVIYIFDEDLLWKQFFMKLPALSSVLHDKKIKSLQELVSRTQDYYEKALTSY